MDSSDLVAQTVTINSVDGQHFQSFGSFSLDDQNMLLNDHDYTLLLRSLNDSEIVGNEVVLNDSTLNPNLKNGALIALNTTLETPEPNVQIVSSMQIDENDIGIAQNYSQSAEHIDKFSIEQRLELLDKTLEKCENMRMTQIFEACENCTRNYLEGFDTSDNDTLNFNHETRWICVACKFVCNFERGNNSTAKITGEYICYHCNSSMYMSPIQIGKKLFCTLHRDHPYECNLCHKTVLRSFDFKSHMNLHFNIMQYVCDVCGKSFVDISNLYTHLRLHYKIKPYICTICKKRFAQIRTLQVHHKSHRISGSCLYCKDTFTSSTKLRVHLSDIHGKFITKSDANKIYNAGLKASSSSIKKRGFYCYGCGMKFTLKEYLSEHIKDSKECLAINMILPSGCPKSFNSLDKLQNSDCSIYVDFKDKTDPSNIETAELSTVSESISHMVSDDCDNSDETYVTCICASQDGDDVYVWTKKDITTHDASCAQISKTADESIESHIRVNDSSSSSVEVSSNVFFPIIEKSNNIESKIHVIKKAGRTKRIGKYIEKGNSNFSCEECGKKFPRLCNLRQHIGLHDASLRKYKCEVCGKSFSYLTTYESHLKSHSTNESEKFTCKRCTKTYKSQKSLNQHVQKDHEGRVNFTCELCGKGFFAKSQFTYHMRIHNRELPYVCSYCGKAFSHTSHLYQHERKHTGEKPHECLHCSRRFSQTVSLRSHIKKIHKLAPI